MTILPTTMKIPFHGDTLIAAEKEGEPFVAIKPICERLGLSWQPQHRKLTEPDGDWGIINLVIPTSGGLQEMTCLALFDFPLWLASISPNKVANDLREVFKRYRKEAKQVLFDHFVNRQKRSEAALEASHTHLLAQYPCWAKLVTPLRGGTSEYLAFKRSNMTREQFRAEMKEIERCGLLDPSKLQTTRTETLLEERDNLRLNEIFLKARIKELEGEADV